jgi:hypothetical protein
MDTPKTVNILIQRFDHDDCKLVEKRRIKMLTVFGLSIVLYFVQNTYCGYCPTPWNWLQAVNAIIFCDTIDFTEIGSTATTTTIPKPSQHKQHHKQVPKSQKAKRWRIGEVYMTNPLEKSMFLQDLGNIPF